MKNLAFMVAMMSAFQEAGSTKNRLPNNNAVRTGQKSIIPAGCKKYFFTSTGSIYTIKPEGLNVVFECIAMSDKSAQKKFDKWYNQNNLTK